MLVHFPIALLSTGIIFDAVAAFSRRSELQRFGWWMMLTGTVGLILAVASGLVAEADLEVGKAAQAVLDTHKQFAFLLAGTVSLVFLWRLSFRGAIPGKMTWLFWLFYGTGIGLLWVVASYGGILVFQHGVSVSPP